MATPKTDATSQTQQQPPADALEDVTAEDLGYDDDAELLDDVDLDRQDTAGPDADHADASTVTDDEDDPDAEPAPSQDEAADDEAAPPAAAGQPTGADKKIEQLNYQVKNLSKQLQSLLQRAEDKPGQQLSKADQNAAQKIQDELESLQLNADDDYQYLTHRQAAQLRDSVRSTRKRLDDLAAQYEQQGKALQQVTQASQAANWWRQWHQANPQANLADARAKWAGFQTEAQAAGLDGDAAYGYAVGKFKAYEQAVARAKPAATPAKPTRKSSVAPPSTRPKQSTDGTDLTDPGAPAAAAVDVDEEAFSDDYFQE